MAQCLIVISFGKQVGHHAVIQLSRIRVIFYGLGNYFYRIVKALLFVQYRRIIQPGVNIYRIQLNNLFISVFSFGHVAKLVFSISYRKPVIGIGNIQVERFFVKVQGLKVAFLKIKGNTDPKPGVSQFWVHFYRFFVESTRIVHLLQLFVTFANSTISVGIRLLILKCMTVNLNCFRVFFQVNQRVAFIKVGRNKKVLYQYSVIISVDSFLEQTKLGKRVTQVIPCGIAIRLVIDVLLIKSNALFLVIQHIVAKCKLIQSILIFHILLKAKLQVSDV